MERWSMTAGDDRKVVPFGKLFLRGGRGLFGELQTFHFLPAPFPFLHIVPTFGISHSGIADTVLTVVQRKL